MALSDAKRQMVPMCGALAQQLDVLRELTVKLSEDIRLISHELHPATLEHAGLPAALHSLSAEFTKIMNVPVDFCFNGEKPEIPPNLALCCYRVVQEALRNAAKHAHATLVQVSIHVTDSRVFLSIADNGMGIELAKLYGSAGLGITSMRERVRLLGGEFEILRRDIKGTLVAVTLPLNGHHPCEEVEV
jgi:two-component system sensor histidine kinase UhpB